MNKFNLAEQCYNECKEKGVSYKEAPKFLEWKLKNEDEEISQAVEVYVRYNLNDQSITDNEIDFAKELLKNN